MSGPRGDRTRWSAWRLIGGLVLASIGIACSSVPDVPRKTHLTRLPFEYVQGSLVASTDLQHFAYFVRDAEGVSAVRDGVRGPAFEDATMRSFAPGSSRLFYWAQVPGERFLIADGQPVAVGTSRHLFLTFDGTGSRWAVVTGVPKLAGAAYPDPERRITIIADGVEQGRWRDAAVPAFSRDGRHLAAIVEQGPADAPRLELLVDGVAQASVPRGPGACLTPHDLQVDGPRLPAWLRTMYLDDGRLVVLWRDGEGWAVVRDGQRLGGPFAVNIPAPDDGPGFEVTAPECADAAAIVSTSLVAAEKAPVVAWWERVAGSGGKWRVVRDGVPVDDVLCLEAWTDYPPLLTPDGKTVAYPCVSERTEGGGRRIDVVVGSRRIGPFGDVWSAALSDDGRHIAFAGIAVAVGGGWAVFVDGVAAPPRYRGVWRPRFDPTGRHVAWEGLLDRSGRGALNLDGHDLARFDELVSGPSYEIPGHVSWVVRRARLLTRVSLPLDR